MNYKEAISQLKKLEVVQRYMKKLRPNSIPQVNSIRKNLRMRKVEINLLLSIIAAHKTSRKLFNKIKTMQQNGE